MPKITCSFTCDTEELIPLITSGNIEAIKEKYDVAYFEKKMFRFPPNSFHFGKSGNPLNGKYTPVSQSFDVNDNFFDQLKSISQISG